jgi:hypothetical protein
MRQIIEKSIFVYGFLPLLTVLEIYEEEEEYERCAVILDVIREHSKKFNIDIPTKYGKEAIDKLKEYCESYNVSGEVALTNNATYALEIIHKIETETENL